MAAEMLGFGICLAEVEAKLEKALVLELADERAVHGKRESRELRELREALDAAQAAAAEAVHERDEAVAERNSQVHNTKQH